MKSHWNLKEERGHRPQMHGIDVGDIEKDEEKKQLIEVLAGYQTIVTDPDDYSVDELRAILKKITDWKK